MIKISSFSIDNFFSFKNNTSFNDLTSLNTFIGPNNAGKSNVFRTLKWYQDLVITNYEPKKTENNHHQFNRGSSSFFINFKLNNHLVDNLNLPLNNCDIS
jgi:AAA15 family ATPase/GTPase